MNEEIMIGSVDLSELKEILKSDSVYWALRFAYKSPSQSGVDDCEDSYNVDLYNLCCELRKA
jgi:hypothetical protein